MPQTTTLDSTIAVLRREIADLRGRLATSEAVLDAIRSGEADAIAVETTTGLRVFTLEGAEQPYRIMVEAMSEGAVTATRDGVILYCNPRFAEMVNAGLETILGSSLPVHFAGDDAGKIATAIRDSKTETKRASATLLARGGTSVPVNIAVRDQTDGGTESVAIVITDLTERERWEQAREKANRATRMSTIFHSVNDGIFLIDPDTSEIIEVNQSGCEMYGYTPEELVGHSVEIFESGQPPYGSPSTIDMFAKARKDGPQSLERRSRRKDGSLFWVEISLRVVPLAANLAALAVVRDITERKLAHEQIVHMARYDALTGLANRGVFVEALDQAIARARRSSRGFAVLYLDLDHFKDVNDTLGHPVGDLLLQAVAGRLRASVRRVDTVARFGGDEFAVIITDMEEPTDAAIGIERIQAAISEPITLQGIPAVASGAVEKILSAFNDPYVIQGNQIQSGTTVGIAVYASEPDAETLLAHADVALYRAKSERRGTYRFFSDAMDAEVRERVAMKTELREAIASNQFFLMYQPQVDIETGRIVGLEALVRWNHPTRGLLEPGWFIPAAEQSGLIVPLGHWVLAEACRQTKEWLDAGVAPSLIAVNMSGLQFRAPRELERDIVAVITASGLPPGYLELELTEGVLMETSRENNDLLLRLRERGHRIAIDDFGSGYSSLDYLRRYPVDRIKIAQSFIADIGIVSGSDAIVRAALGLARELDIEVVVEGVETKTQLDMLKAWGCRIVQGYYYARPKSASDVTVLLQMGKIEPTSTQIAQAPPERSPDAVTNSRGPRGNGLQASTPDASLVSSNT